MNLTPDQRDTLHAILTSDQTDRSFPGAHDLATLNIVWYTVAPGCSVPAWRVTGYGAAQAVLHGLQRTHRIVPRPATPARPIRGCAPAAYRCKS